MRVPRARAESGEGTVETAAASQRVLTPLTNSSGLVLPAFSSVESLNSGLTRTTPTLTPTTLRNIEETFMAFDRGLVAPPVSHQHQAGFVTPQVAAGGGSFAAAAEPHQLYAARRAAVSHVPPSAQSACGQFPSESPSPPADLTPRAVPQGHHRGGRRPKDDDEVSPEEDQRRRVRRERNKQAAARCRRRRLDLTNTLQIETEELEDERSSLEREIQMLTAQKEELNFLLEAHRPCCKLGRDKENAPKRRVIVKQEPAKIARTEAALVPPPPPVSSAPQLITKVPRPTTLSVAGFATATNMHKDVPISTPSQGLGLNFDSLLQGGTGLTPISGAALPPLMPLTSGSLATPVVSQPDRRADMLSPETGKELVSL